MIETRQTLTSNDVASHIYMRGLPISNLRGRSVKFAVPTYRDISPFHYISMIQTIALLNSVGVHCDLGVMVGIPVADARNVLANSVLKSSCTDILFIDADESWNPLDIVSLLASGMTFIAGVYRQKSDKPSNDLSAWNARPVIKDGGAQVTKSGFVEVEYVGAGMMLVNREVLEKMVAEHPEWKREKDGSGEEFYEFFHTDLDDSGLHRHGEDVSFCNRWRAMGGRIFVDPTIKVHHYGTHDYYGDYSQFFDHPAFNTRHS